MKYGHARQNYLKALWIYLIALLLLGLTFHSEAKDPATSSPISTAGRFQN